MRFSQPTAQSTTACSQWTSRPTSAHTPLFMLIVSAQLWVESNTLRRAKLQENRVIVHRGRFSFTQFQTSPRNNSLENGIKLLPLSRCVLLVSESHSISPISSRNILLHLLMLTSAFKHRLLNCLHLPSPTKLASSQWGSTRASRSSAVGKDIEQYELYL